MQRCIAAFSGTYWISHMDIQDIIVGYASGDIAWIQKDDTKEYCRIPIRDNTKDISYEYVSWISIWI
jgi:hypothetical protein